MTSTLLIVQCVPKQGRSATTSPTRLEPHMNRTIALVVVKAALGASLALGFTAAPHGDAHADDTTVIFEDDPRWSCVDDGNKVCGPGNPQGVPAGRYDEGGVLIDPWPVDSYTYDDGTYVGGYT